MRSLRKRPELKKIQKLKSVNESKPLKEPRSDGGFLFGFAKKEGFLLLLGLVLLLLLGC